MTADTTLYTKTHGNVPRVYIWQMQQGDSTVPDLADIHLLSKLELPPPSLG